MKNNKVNKDSEREPVAILLAGGQSKRMKTDKALLHFGGKSFLQACVDALLSANFPTILISRATELHDTDDLDSPKTSVKYVQDIFANHGPLSGIYSCLSYLTENPALSHTECQSAIVCSVDQPLMDSKTLLTLREEGQSREKNIRFALPHVEKQPFFPFYIQDVRTSCEVLESIIRSGNDLSLHHFFNLIHIQKTTLPDIRCIKNVNTQEGYQALVD